MKRTIKRILCAAFSCSLVCALATGQAVRLLGSGAEGTTDTISAAYETVTEKFDVAALRKQNFNAQVLKVKNELTQGIAAQTSPDLTENDGKEQDWNPQPYSAYYNEKYVLPMGGYVYRLDDNDEKMDAKEEYYAVSRYDQDGSNGEMNNPISSTGIKALGLFGNAQAVKYKLYNEQTGDLVLENYISGIKQTDLVGAPTPSNLELGLSPEDYNLAANGQYRMDFEFFTNIPAEGELAPQENTYSFSFTVDYEAPVLENVRVRYYDYKDGAKVKQKIYLDVDVYDNHYAQAIMLCYPQEKNGGKVLNLATEYPTPVRNAVKNGTTTVSIEVTDIYEEYGDKLYLQIDDYALNGCLYKVNIEAANAAQTPDNGFTLASNQSEITLGIYQTHKVKLKNIGSAHLSNYVWGSLDSTIADVRNGVIVGLKAGETTIFVSDPDKDPKKVQEIHVTVTEEQTGSLASVPSLSFGVVKTNTEALQKATGVVPVSLGQTIPLKIQADPWYHPMTGLSFKWSSTDESVATVDENGVVQTLKKGTAIIVATVLYDGVETRYSTSVTLRVQEEFNVSNFTLNDYDGIGYNQGSVEDGTDILVIPTDMNIMYIGEDAFKDNENVRRIVIPASVVEIHESAFENCKALEEIYFVSEKHRQTAGQAEDTSIDFSNLSLIHRRAFYNCKSLKKVDFSNVKTITLDQEAFLNCEKLDKIVNLPSVNAAQHRAFKNCVSLTSADLSGLHVSGENVFENCVALHTVITDRFTAIGKNMFVGCIGLREKISLCAAKIGNGAFSGCVNLTGVKLEASNAEIGERAFENCGTGLEGGFEIDFNGKTVKSIGSGAFKGAKLAVENETFTLPDGLTSIGENVFEDCQTVKTVALGNVDLANAKLLGAAFKGLSVTVAESSTDYAALQGVIYALENGEPKKIVYVNDNACSGVAGILDLSALALNEIGDYAFAGVKGITEVVFPASLTEIGEGAFAESSVSKINFNGAAIGEIPTRAFYGTKIKSLALPASVSKIGAYAFADCSIVSITYDSSLTEIGDYAFFRAKNLTAINLENVFIIGDYAFYDTALGELNLTLAKSIGAYAFAASEKAAYTSLFIPAVEKIGAFAFLGGSEMVVALPQSVKEIGIGAFASSNKLLAITFATESEEIVTTNGTFFVEDNVLYRYLDKDKTQFALLCYPAALPGTILETPVQTLNEKQSRVYKIKEGTVRIEAYAFYDLQKGALNKVEIPYSVKVIGDAAFFASGIKEYTFESIQAPVLETSYRADVEAAIKTLANNSNAALYKGYYYSNFQKDIYNYTSYVGNKSDLTINYPTNGKGYDSYIYRLYFGTKKKLGAVMTDDTRACLGLVSALTSAEEVATWLNWNADDAEKKQLVEAFSAQVKAARASYNNVLKDEAQAAIFGEENGAKLLAIEEQLRAVKTYFNIPVYVTSVKTAKTSAHKAIYTEGEKFDWTGLVITVTYDDGSTVELTPESGALTLKGEGAILTLYDSYVIVEYTENETIKSAYVAITVNERKLSSIEKYPEEANVMRNVLIYGGGAMMLVGGFGVLVMLIISKRKKAKALAAASEIEPFYEKENAEAAISDAEEKQE